MSRSAPLYRLPPLLAAVCAAFVLLVVLVHTALAKSGPTRHPSTLNGVVQSKSIELISRNSTGADLAPEIVASYPVSGAVSVPVTATLSLTFSEPVNLPQAAAVFSCSYSGDIALTLVGGPVSYELHPQNAPANGELCGIAVDGRLVSDQDVDDPPDEMTDNWRANFTMATAEFMLINEVDSRTPGIDDAEFIELYDGGRGGTRLDGLSIILFSGHNDQVYASFDLAGGQTDEQGYFLIGNRDVAGVDLVMDDSLLQNGADAVALYSAPASAMPPGTALRTTNLLDALVYGTGQADDAQLLTLLYPGEPQVNEYGRGLDDLHSMQRCPNGSGKQRQTGSYQLFAPTPKQLNICNEDSPPQIVSTTPADGDIEIAPSSSIAIQFSEAVTLSEVGFEIVCDYSGEHDASVTGVGVQITLQPLLPFAHGEHCSVTVRADQVSDADNEDPPDHLEADSNWSFDTSPAEHMLINEVDADTPGADTAEFIELYDGGAGGTLLNGLVIVLFNGADNLSNRAIDLDGYWTDALGRFVIGNAAVAGAGIVLPDGALQNGADAVALYAGDSADFPNGSAISADKLLDAVVYGSSDDPDAELLSLLLAGEEQLNEDGRDNAAGDSMQRCPDGAGGARRSAAFKINLATPHAPNKCTFDEAPFIISTSPVEGQSGVAIDSSLTLDFNEEVELADGWFSLVCEDGGAPAVRVEHLGQQIILHPQSNLQQGDTCELKISGEKVHDRDADDPPDVIDSDILLRFQTAETEPPMHMKINEVDADTPGADTAEFVELYDGGSGSTALDGLVIVFFNGADSRAYRAIELDGFKTDQDGYFLLGNAAVPGVKLILANGVLQNGPDAVALYAGDAADFAAGASVSATNLLDALVYSTGIESAPGLVPLLHAGEKIIDEDGRGAKDDHSNQRCPNGAGEQRQTQSFLQNTPTPGQVNFCVVDTGPRVVAHTPLEGAIGVARDAELTLTFDEAVTLTDGAVDMACDKGGAQNLVTYDGPVSFTFKPVELLSASDRCTVTIEGDSVHDIDNYDPPDEMPEDYSFAFTTAGPPLARHMLINEVDSDTESVDTAEFIELYDGGAGQTALEGLRLVLINGNNEQVYRQIDLAGYSTDADGYFVIGSAAVPSVDLPLANGVIQNGPDAIALYIAEDYEENASGRPGLNGLLDAFVYLTGDEEDEGLDYLLLAGEPQVDEGALRDAAVDSSQRCPNGQGGQRRTSDFLQNLPTPGDSNNCVPDFAPKIVGVFPKDGSLEAAVDTTVVVKFNEPVTVEENWIAISCVGQRDLILEIGGGPVEYEIQPPLLPPFSTCTAVIDGDKVRDRDGYVDALPQDFIWQFDTGKPLIGNCGDTSTPIHTIQGAAEESPLAGEVGLIVEGIVSGDFQGPHGLGGFFIQEVPPAAGGVSAASQGLFVLEGPQIGDVSRGDMLRLQGEVAEVGGMTGLINVTGSLRCASDRPVEPLPLVLPVSIDHSWEALEGMLVTIEQPMTAVSSDRWGSEGIVLLASERLYSPTELATPGEEAQAAAGQNNRKQILLDDGSPFLNPRPYPPYLGAADTLRLGDTANSLIGIVSQHHGEYRLQPVEDVRFVRQNPRPILNKPIPGRTRLVHLSSAGFFNGNGKGGGFKNSPGAQNAEEYERQRQKLAGAIVALDAGIIGLTEIENDGFGETSAVADLLATVNEKASESRHYYAAVIADDRQPAFADTVALFYRSDVVRPEGEPFTLAMPPFEGSSRRPLGQKFSSKLTGESYVVLVVQLAGRDDCPSPDDANSDQGDGQACWNTLRKEAAAALASWAAAQQLQDNAGIVILGDLNSYAREEPTQILETAGLVNTALAFGPEAPYGSVTNGESGMLNYAFVSPDLAQKTAAVLHWHINADEPAALDFRLANQPALYRADAYRSAEQDPLVIDLAATALSAAFTSSAPVTIGEAVQFTNASHGPQPLGYGWDFGDGSPPNHEASPSHIYAKPGTYLVTLTVTTIWGETAVYSAPVEVRPASIFLPILPAG